MCKRQEEKARAESLSISENIAVRRHERAQVEKAEMAECIREKTHREVRGIEK